MLPYSFTIYLVCTSFVNVMGCLDMHSIPDRNVPSGMYRQECTRHVVLRNENVHKIDYGYCCWIISHPKGGAIFKSVASVFM